MWLARQLGVLALIGGLLAFGTLIAMLLSPILEAERSARDSRLVVRAAGCEFRAGFKALHERIPKVVGDCLEDERYNPFNGDSLQSTSGGLLVWRKADNWTAFTDGATTWINGPFGLQARANGERFPWEDTVSQPPAPPPPPNQSIAQLQQAVLDTARRADVPESAVQVVSVQAREWPDTSLGCPKPGMFYAQVVTPGYLIVLEAAGRSFEYHTDSGRRVELCS